jgi:hypothetical protein
MNALSSLYEKKSDTEVPSYFLGGMMDSMVGALKNINNSAINSAIDAQRPNTDEEIEKEALARAAEELKAYNAQQGLTDNPNLSNNKPEYFIDSLEDQRGLYSAMNPDKSVYHIDSMDKARNLFGLLNPGAEYISSMEHMWDDYARRNPDLMRVAKDPGNKSIGGGNWLRGVNELWQLGQRHYMRHGGREGRTLRTPNTMYLNGSAVDPSELPEVGNYYFQDGTQFTNDMLPSYGYYDDNFNQVNPEQNSAILSIMANAQNPDAERQEFYNPIEYAEIENLNPIAKRNMALRQKVSRRAPEATYANNYLEWMKGQDDLMKEFVHNFNMSDYYGQNDVPGMQNLMSIFAKSNFDEGVGDKEMPQYRMEQQPLPIRKMRQGAYRDAMNRLYQPVASTRSQRTLGGTNKARGLAALLGAMV